MSHRKSPPSPARPSRLVRGALVALAAVALSACAPGPGDAYQDFTEAVAKGEVEKAKQYLPPTVTAMLPDAKLGPALAELTSDFTKRGGLDGVKVLDEKIEGDLATVIAETRYGNGNVSTDTIPMIRDSEGNWRINPPMDDTQGK